MASIVVTGASRGIGRALCISQWVDWAAVDDATWYESVQREFGLDARPTARPSVVQS